MISIHTPAQGVTFLGVLFLLMRNISIHTPAQGVTLKIAVLYHHNKFQSTLPHREWRYIRHRYLCGLLYFNPHSRTGSDLDIDVTYELSLISIHTPAQGVTDRWFQVYDKLIFQSTLPHREWRILVLDMYLSFLFQSTLPHREWLSYYI